jgi:hypothetical protein
MRVEMLHGEAAINHAIQTQHPLDLRHRRAPQRWLKATVRLPRCPLLLMPITPPAKCPLTHTKQFRCLQLAQLRRPIRPSTPKMCIRRISS